ncbi:MAG: PorV/PorQ family protein [Elusimicrobia bacterium]|nr:PorV/PorQ family protein [Elusimicrobiota bacterium]
MRPLLVLLLLLFGGAAGTAQAAFNADSAGTSAGQFLKLGAAPRGAAMGEAMAAAADDAAALYWNPAGLAILEKKHAQFNHALLYQSVFCDSLAYAHPVRPAIKSRRRELKPSGLGTLAIGVFYLNAGSIEEVDNTCSSQKPDCKTGASFTPNDIALTAGWGSTITDNLDIGFALKYIDSRIQRSARTGAADAGIRLKFLLADSWPYVLAASASNFGGKLRYDQRSDPLPAAVRLGQSLRPVKNLLLSFDVVGPSDNKIYPNAGAEVSVPFGEDMVGMLRTGFSGRVSGSDLEGLAGFSFGFGLSAYGFGLDYAWAPYGLLGQAHRMGVSYRF